MWLGMLRPVSCFERGMGRFGDFVERRLFADRRTRSFKESNFLTAEVECLTFYNPGCAFLLLYAVRSYAYFDDCEETTLRLLCDCLT